MKNCNRLIFSSVLLFLVLCGVTFAMPDMLYRQSLTGQMGYAAFPGGSNIDSTFQGSLLFTHRYNPAWTLEAKLGVIPSLATTPGSGTQFRTINPYEIGVAYDLKTKWNGTFPYVRSGFNGDFSNYNGHNLALYVGAGLVYPLSNRNFLRADMAWGRTLTVSVGFGRSFRVFWDDYPEQPASVAVIQSVPTPTIKYITKTIYVTATPAPVVKEPVVVPVAPVEAATPVSCNISVPAYFYTFAGTVPEFTDAQDHWALSSLRRASLLGLLSIEKGVIRPNETVTKTDMADMVVKATYLHQILGKMATRLGATIEGSPTAFYTVDLSILDKTGKEVRVLVYQERRKAGDFEVLWDGTDGVSPVEAGTYTVLLRVSRAGKVMDESRAEIVARPFKAVALVGDGQSVVFSEKHESDWATKIIQNFTNQGYVDANLGKKFRNAEKPITKIDFIVAVSKALSQLGATGPAQPFDWNYYKDKDAIPSYAIGNLEVYVNAFGFGGVRGTSMLEPSKKITRAEAAEILNRLLNWNIKNPGVLPIAGGQTNITQPTPVVPQKVVKPKTVKASSKKKVISKKKVPAPVVTKKNAVTKTKP